VNELLFTLANKFVYLFTNIFPVLIIAIILANLLNDFGIIGKVSFLVRPIVKFSRLPEEAALSIITFIASGSAGYAMLSALHEREVIDERETIISSFVSSFFGFLNHLFIYYIPVVLPVLGLYAGGIFITARLFVGISVTLTAVITGHFMLKERKFEIKKTKKIPEIPKVTESKKDVLRQSFNRSKKALSKILIRFVIVYMIVGVASFYGVFDLLKEAEFSNLVKLSPEASAIVAVGFADTTSAVIMAGSMLKDQMIGEIEAVSALLLANVLSFSVVLVRHSLPGKIAYFGARLGTKIAIYGAFLNIVYTILVLFLLHSLML
jgi:hypothetical protein